MQKCYKVKILKKNRVFYIIPRYCIYNYETYLSAAFVLQNMMCKSKGRSIL